MGIILPPVRRDEYEAIGGGVLCTQTPPSERNIAIVEFMRWFRVTYCGCREATSLHKAVLGAVAVIRHACCITERFEDTPVATKLP